MVTGYLHYFQNHLYPWVPPKGTEGAGRSACRATFNHLPAVLAKQGGPSWLKVSKCDTHLPEGLEGGAGELQACQSELGAGEGHVADHLECHHTTRTGQPGDQA